MNKLVASKVTAELHVHGACASVSLQLCAAPSPGPKRIALLSLTEAYLWMRRPGPTSHVHLLTSTHNWLAATSGIVGTQVNVCSYPWMFLGNNLLTDIAERQRVPAASMSICAAKLLSGEAEAAVLDSTTMRNWRLVHPEGKQYSMSQDLNNCVLSSGSASPYPAAYTHEHDDSLSAGHMHPPLALAKQPPSYRSPATLYPHRALSSYLYIIALTCLRLVRQSTLAPSTLRGAIMRSGLSWIQYSQSGRRAGTTHWRWSGGSPTTCEPPIICPASFTLVPAWPCPH